MRWSWRGLCRAHPHVVEGGPEVAADVEVEGHGLEDAGALHLDRHRLAIGPQLCPVDLRQKKAAPMAREYKIHLFI